MKPRAIPVLLVLAACNEDQFYRPEKLTFNAGLGGTTERGQTFTVGKTGTMVSLDIWIKRFEENVDLEVDVRPTEIGEPTTNNPEPIVPVGGQDGNDGVLGSKTVKWELVAGEVTWLRVNVDDFEVTEGDVLAITLRAPGGSFNYGVMGAAPTKALPDYEGGGSCERATDNHGWSCGKDDFGFATYVKVEK